MQTVCRHSFTHIWRAADVSEELQTQFCVFNRVCSQKK